MMFQGQARSKVLLPEDLRASARPRSVIKPSL